MTTQTQSSSDSTIFLKPFLSWGSKVVLKEETSTCMYFVFYENKKDENSFQMFDPSKKGQNGRSVLHHYFARNLDKHENFAGRNMQSTGIASLR